MLYVCIAHHIMCVTWYLNLDLLLCVCAWFNCLFVYIFIRTKRQSSFTAAFSLMFNYVWNFNPINLNATWNKSFIFYSRTEFYPMIFRCFRRKIKRVSITTNQFIIQELQNHLLFFVCLSVQSMKLYFLLVILLTWCCRHDAQTEIVSQQQYDTWDEPHFCSFCRCKQIWFAKIKWTAQPSIKIGE